jgi:hypothetical protein
MEVILDITFADIEGLMKRLQVRFHFIHINCYFLEFFVACLVAGLEYCHEK